jgi:hypothetical protein
MPLFTSNKVVVSAKYGANATSANVVPVSNADIRLDPIIAKGEFKCLNGSMGNVTTWVNTDDSSISGGTITGFLTGNDATGTALATLPAWDELYKIAGLTGTVVATTSVTYAPNQIALSNASQVAIWRDGRKRVISGVVGSLTISGKVGEPISQSIAISGFGDIATTAEANPAGVCPNEALLLVLKSIDTLTVGGTAVKAESFTLNEGVDIQKFYMIGNKAFERTDFKSTLELTYLKEDETLLASYTAGTTSEVIITAGSVNGKKAQIKASQAVIEDVKETSLNGKEAYTVTFNLKGDANGINQWTLKYGTIV